jgi:hypothetical protein
VYKRQVEGNEIVARGGTRYRAIYLGGRSQTMTLPTLRRLAAMVEAGATLIGQKPTGSPSLSDDTDEFKAVADRLWSNPRVLATNDVEAAMASAGVGPDFSYAKPTPDSQVLFVHRRLADGDIYFLNNRKNRPEAIEARFRVTGKRPELWNAITGTSTPLSFTVTATETIVPLAMGPEDASFIVFREPLAAGVTGAAVATSAPFQHTPLSAPWSVAFQSGRGAPASIRMPTLAPINESADPGVKYFSGIATYTTSFVAPRQARAGAPLWLDLGKVGDVAEVRVNGQMAGTVWFAPNRVDISRLVRRGANTLEVRVANLWVNRLIGDKQPGAQKITFTAAPTYLPDAPLRPSGLIGPVTLDY